MTEILRFLIERCPFLYEDYNFKFVDSETTRGFGGNAYLVLASRYVQLKLVRDREQLFLDVGPKNGGREDWFSIDLVWTLFTDEIRESAELDDEYVAFLRGNLEQIETAFAGDRLPDTLKALRRLERERSKRLFG